MSSDVITEPWKPLDGGHTPPLFEPDDGLFPDPPHTARIGRDARRTQRQRQMIELGHHPLRRTTLHPDAPEDASPDDRFPRPLTCGTCAHSYLLQHGGELGGRVKTSLKCNDDDGRWLTLGKATTINRWWPGCTDWAEKAGTPEPGHGA